MSLPLLIKEFEAHENVSWPLTTDVTRDALVLLGLPDTADSVHSVYTRYLGEADSVGALVRAAFADTIPAGTWPFTHIDWEAAASESDVATDARNIGRHWFDVG